MFNEAYRAQTALLVATLPFVAAETVFALKGGTAINLFVRDMPRLSVDIDLTYLPLEERAKSLRAIEAALLRIKAAIERGLPPARVTPVPLTKEARITGLTVQRNLAQIKIEVTPVLRGAVFPTRTRRISSVTEAEFGFAEMQVLSFADLYGGKIVAALDRQHPRDLFDVHLLFAAEGLDDDTRAAVAVYLASHPRPMAEVLAPSLKTLDREYARGFIGMTNEAVPLADLDATRARLIQEVVDAMPLPHKRFLLSVERGAPDWSFAPDGIERLPAIQWRLINIKGLTPDRRAANVAILAKVLSLPLGV